MFSHNTIYCAKENLFIYSGPYFYSRPPTNKMIECKKGAKFLFLEIKIYEFENVIYFLYLNENTICWDRVSKEWENVNKLEDIEDYFYRAYSYVFFNIN